MSFVIRKLRVAEQDTVEGALWYEKREPGLGDDFLDEVDLAVQALEQDALLYRVRFAYVRRAPIRRFKYYGVYYLIREHEVWGHRDPSWTSASSVASATQRASWIASQR